MATASLRGKIKIKPKATSQDIPFGTIALLAIYQKQMKAGKVKMMSPQESGKRLRILLENIHSIKATALAKSKIKTS